MLRADAVRQVCSVHTPVAHVEMFLEIATSANLATRATSERRSLTTTNFDLDRFATKSHRVSACRFVLAAIPAARAAANAAASEHLVGEHDLFEECFG